MVSRGEVITQEVVDMAAYGKTAVPADLMLGANDSTVSAKV